jgi:micrococcal nuclease
VEVVDRDTIKVDIGGDVHTVRYIGIDTLELAEPMGVACCEANEALFEGQTVYLEKDVSSTDQHGRLLRYVYPASGLLVNEELVRQGYAQSVAYSPDTSLQGTLADIE